MSATSGRAQQRLKNTPNAGGTEVEAKYAVPDDSTFEKLLSLETLGEYRLVPRGELRLTDHYLDTPDRGVHKGGYACRRRVTDAGGPEVIAVKGLGASGDGVHRRPEHELQVQPGSPPERWPNGPAREIVLRLSDRRPLAELLTVRQHRTQRDVESNGRRAAVLSLDRVEFGSPASRTAYELEIELTPSGDDADLRALRDLLQPFGLRPQALSKFVRALALLDAREPIPLPQPEEREPAAAPAQEAQEGAAKRRAAASPPARGSGRAGAAGARPGRKVRKMGVLATDPMAEAGRKILRFHYEQMLSHESGTIVGTDLEELHDMRVATRRQRAALRIAWPHYRRKIVRPLRDGLRTLGGCLGDVRDLDVLLAAARAHQSALGATEAAAFQGLIDAWTRRADAARPKLLAHLAGRNYADFKQVYSSFLETPGAGARSSNADGTPLPALVSDVLRTEVWAHYGRIRAFEPALSSAPAETLHALRIEGKRLRYLLEFFREVLHPCADEAIKAMVALQDHLGALQDAVVTTGLIREFLSGPDATTVRGAASAAGRYLDSRHAKIQEMRRGLERPWKKISGPGFKRCLSRTVAAL